MRSYLTDDELLAARDQAFIDLGEWEYTQYQPRWYKRHQKWINPWISMDELLEAQKHRKELHSKWLELHIEAAKRGLKAMSDDVLFRWKEISTSDGRRYIRME